MSKGQWAVLGIFTFSVVALLAYEFYALSTKASGDTISEYVWDASHRYPMVPFLIGWVFGLLCGHFFWQRAVDVVKDVVK